MAFRELAALAARVADLEARLAGAMRHGRVAEVDAGKARLRLDLGPTHGGEGRFLSPWIPYAQMAGALKIHTPPSEGQQYTVFAPGGDLQQAVALPLSWSESNAAPSGAEDENVVTYGDVRIELRSDVMRLSIGDVVMETDGVGMTLTGDLTVEGDVRFLNGVVTHNDKDIGDTHRHGGVISGGANTDVPIG